MSEETLASKLALLELRNAQKHRNHCRYNPSIWANPDEDFCTCDLHARKQAIQEEIDSL